MAAELKTTTAQTAFAFVAETLFVTIVAFISICIAMGCAVESVKAANAFGFQALPWAVMFGPDLSGVPASGLSAAASRIDFTIRLRHLRQQVI